MNFRKPEDYLGLEKNSHKYMGVGMKYEIRLLSLGKILKNTWASERNSEEYLRLGDKFEEYLGLGEKS
jgi:hypothetical protein